MDFTKMKEFEGIRQNMMSSLLKKDINNDIPFNIGVSVEGYNKFIDSFHKKVPVGSPDSVRVMAEFKNSYYGLDSSAIQGFGFTGYFNTSTEPPEYNATCESDREIYVQTDTAPPVIVFTGAAVYSKTGTPASYMPLKIGVSVKGYDRYYETRTDIDGRYRFEFKPLSNESGQYIAWACHPVVVARLPLEVFNIIDLTVSPKNVNLKLSQNSTYGFPMTVTNNSEIPLYDLIIGTKSLQPKDIECSVLPGYVERLNPGETTTLNVTAHALPDSGPLAIYNLTVESFSSPNSTSPPVGEGRVRGIRTSTINIETYTAEPYLRISPSQYIEMSVSQEDQRAATIQISNTGYGSLLRSSFTHISPSPPVGEGSGEGLSWVTIKQPGKTGDIIGNIPSGGSASLEFIAHPDSTVLPGIYYDRIQVTAENYPPFYINMSITVSSSKEGNLVFKVRDIFDTDIDGSMITIFNQAIYAEKYTGVTGATGTLTFGNIPTGRYSWRAEKKGYQWQGGEIVIELIRTSFATTDKNDYVSNERILAINILFNKNIVKKEREAEKEGWLMPCFLLIYYTGSATRLFADPEFDGDLDGTAGGAYEMNFKTEKPPFGVIGTPLVLTISQNETREHLIKVTNNMVRQRIFLPL